MLGEMCLKNGSVGPARPCSFPFWEVFWVRSDENSKSCKTVFFFRGSGCNEGGHSVGRLFGGWIVCEIVQNRRKTSMIRPKAGKFFSGFRRDVWHRGWGKCVSKMGPLDRPGHAVSLFWRVLVKVPEVFYVYTASTSLPQPALSYQNTMTNDFLMHSDATFDTGGGWNVVRKSRPGHAVSLFWRVLFQQLPQACHNQQYRTTTLWFFTGFRRDVRHGRGMKCGSKMLLVGRSGHAVSALSFKAYEVFHVQNFWNLLEFIKAIVGSKVAIFKWFHCRHFPTVHSICGHSLPFGVRCLLWRRPLDL